MIAEWPEDMWHAYNLLSIDDELRSTTIRRVTNETATGSTTTSRVHTILKVCVKAIHFDTQASVLSIKGINIEENAYVKVIWSVHVPVLANGSLARPKKEVFTAKIFKSKNKLDRPGPH